MISLEGFQENDSFSPEKIRRELILYLLQNYGSLRTKEISKILGQKPRTIRRDLSKLRDLGKIEGEKLGKGYVWSPLNEEKDKSMYF